METLCFSIFAALVALYIAADGFDLGIGVLTLFMRDEKNRASAVLSLWPVWNGNEVWLLGAVVLLMAAFTPVYAALFSAFYVPVILFGVAVIFRGVALEFHDKAASRAMRRILSAVFGIGSLLAAAAIGFVAGNIMLGNALASSAGLPSMINPFAFGMSLLTLSYCVLHGASFLVYRGHEKARSFFTPALIAFLVLVIVNAAGVFMQPAVMSALTAKPAMLVPLALLLFALIGLIITYLAGKRLPVVLFSGAAGAACVALVASWLYPVLLPAPKGAAALTVFNAASGGNSMPVITVIALAGIPLALLMSFVSYWIFRPLKK